MDVSSLFHTRWKCYKGLGVGHKSKVHRRCPVLQTNYTYILSVSFIKCCGNLEQITLFET